jgi:hypothetical protein
LKEDNELHVTTGGPERAPRSVSRRVRSTIWRLCVLAAVILLAVGIGRLPSGTDRTSLLLRGGMGAAIGVVLMVVVRRSMRALVSPPAPSPEQIDATQADVVYECPLCGTRLRLEVASTGKAPRHCGEPMEAKLVSRG